MTVHIKSNEVEWTGPQTVFAVWGVIESEGSHLLGLFFKRSDAEACKAKADASELRMFLDYVHITTEVVS